jgi:hypothetical protein
MVARNMVPGEPLVVQKVEQVRQVDPALLLYHFLFL